MNSENKDGKSLRILHLEDSPRDAEIIRERLIDSGFYLQLDWASNEQQFTTFLQRDEYDLILADYHLPAFNGEMALRLTQSFSPGVPFICISGAIGEVKAVELLKQGATDYVPKERLDRLPLAVERALDEVRERSSHRLTGEKLSQSEAEFRRLSMEFHGLLDAIPDSLMLLGRDLKLHWVNKAAAETIGLTSETIEDQYCYALWQKRTTPCDPCPAIKSFSTGEPASETVIRSDGTVWDVRAVPQIDENGMVVNVITVNRDITEHRMMEQQLRHSQKMESIGTLAGGIAHDFNNILSTINGYGQVTLMKMADDDPQRLYVQYMLEASDRAAHLTKDLLLFSRKQVAQKKPLDLNVVVKKVEKFLIKVVREDIAYKTLLPEAPIMVLLDENQIGQVLINLVTNAGHSMPKGGSLTVSTEIVTLGSEFVSAHGFGESGSYAYIAVTDTGTGMDKETQQRIFEPFFTTKEAGKGTGLGLSIVYGIIKEHEGYINVYSEPGLGTTFRIYLPIITIEAAQESPEQHQAFIGGTETILLAEDDEGVRIMTKKLLTEFGYTVIEAQNGVEAVARFKEKSEEIDLIFSDLIMPKMNGKEAVDEIRKINPEIKVIFSSGYAPENLRDKVKLDDDVDFIGKPVSPQKLLQKLRSVLDR